LRTFYPKINHHPVWTPPAATEGDALKLALDLNPEAVRLGTSVLSAVWTVDGGRATVSGETLADNVASALVTTNDDGLSILKVKISLGDGQIINQHIKIVSHDTYPSTTDYVA